MSNTAHDTLVLKGGLVVDGTGRAPYHADVGIADGVVSEIGLTMEGDSHIEVENLVVAPGFIDVHTHSDFTLFSNPMAPHAVQQGVTTEVVGNCGFSLAPLSPRYAEDYINLVQPLGNEVPWGWTSMEESLEALESARPTQNVVPLVGHNALRTAVRGFKDGKLSDSELDQMKSYLTEALEAGYWGLSSGLLYVPGVFASEEELRCLTHIVAKYDGLYSTHMRDEGDLLLESIREALDTAIAGGVRLEISHLKASGRENWSKMPAALALIDAAREQGYPVTFDFYPYSAGSTYLSALLPPNLQALGKKEMIARLSDPDTRRQIRLEMSGTLDTGERKWSNLYHLAGGWDGVLVLSLGESGTGIEGKSISEIAAATRADPFDTFFDMIVAQEANVIGGIFQSSEKNIDELAKCSYAMLGSDSVGVTRPNARAHPRAYGSFARFLAQYVRHKQSISLQEAISRITKAPAEMLGIRDRGVLAVGKKADLVVFDLNAVEDRATYADPNIGPLGIHHVFVNGDQVLLKGELTGRRPGEVLRRSKLS